MNNVSTFEACKSIQQAAEKLGDEDMLRVLLSVNSDLIAAEAKYHKTCLASYISKSNLKHRLLSETNEGASDTVFRVGGRNKRVLPKEGHTTCPPF